MIKEELSQVESLLEKGESEEALALITQIAARGNLSERESVSCSLLESKIKIKLGELEDGLSIVENLQKKVENLDDSLLTIDVMILKSEIFWRSGKLDESLRVAENSEQLLADEGLAKENKRASDLLRHKGIVHWYRGELDQAIEFHLQSLSIEEILGDKKGTAMALNNLGLAHMSKGDLQEASDYYQKSKEIYGDLGDNQGEATLLNNLAGISHALGNLNQALEYLQQALDIRKNLSNKLDIAVTYNNIGAIYHLKGDLDHALTFYNKSLAVHEELGIGTQFALALNNLGDLYQLRGDIDWAIEFIQRSLLIYEDMGINEGIARSLANMGECQRRKGNPDQAWELYQRSLSISEEIENDLLVATGLSELVTLALDNNESSIAKDHLQKLESVDKDSDNHIVNQMFRLTNALFLKSSKRARDKFKAQEILEQIVSEEVVAHSLTVTAMIHLCDSLIMELKMTGEQEVLLKIKDLTNRLQKISEDQSSHSILVETYLLQSKLMLVDLNLDQARDLTSKAQTIAKERGLHRLAKIVENESRQLSSQLQDWESIINQNPSREELIDKAQLNELLERMVQKTVESLGIDSKESITTPKYKLVHKNILNESGKSERSKFRVGIAQIGLSQKGDILNELYEEKGSGLIGLREDQIETVLTNIRRMIEKAHSEDVNILIFPEMTIDLTFDHVIVELTKLARQYEMLIVPGSYHDLISKRNLCRVFGTKGILWEQEKHIPAIIHIDGKRFNERIETAADCRDVTICNTEFGRIAVAICRDFLDMDLRVALKNSNPPVDLVINPAFTPVTVDFKAAHFDARRSIYAYCFFANVAEFGDSLIYTPEKERIERNIPKGKEDLIYKDVDLFQLRSERKKWEEQQKKQKSFIQSTR